jgi:hypothetical protein
VKVGYGAYATGVEVRDDIPAVVTGNDEVAIQECTSEEASSLPPSNWRDQTAWASTTNFINSVSAVSKRATPT